MHLDPPPCTADHHDWTGNNPKVITAVQGACRAATASPTPSRHTSLTPQPARHSTTAAVAAYSQTCAHNPASSRHCAIVAGLQLRGLLEAQSLSNTMLLLLQLQLVLAQRLHPTPPHPLCTSCVTALCLVTPTHPHPPEFLRSLTSCARQKELASSIDSLQESKHNHVSRKDLWLLVLTQLQHMLTGAAAAEEAATAKP